MSQSSPSVTRRKMSSDSFTSPAGFASTASEVASTCSRDHVAGGCHRCVNCCVNTDIVASHVEVSFLDRLHVELRHRRRDAERQSKLRLVVGVHAGAPL